MKKTEAYIQAHSTEPGALIAELERETHLKKMYPQMLSGHLQGRFLEFVSRMMTPKAILEIGTFTGYSALCLAEGLAPDGVLHTIEANDEHESFIRKYFRKSKHYKKLHLHIGYAENIVPALDVEFELVFIDAEKKDYIRYYEMLMPKLKSGGFIIADNVLWYEKVLLSDEFCDEATLGIKAFNEYVHKDSRSENVILPVRDGLSLIRKL